MAINFIKDIAEDRLLFSHNNNVIEFYSDSVLTVTTCIITINSKVIVLYPSPTNTFYFNFKEVTSALINKKNYADDLQTDLSTAYTYDWNQRVYLEGAVDIKINFANDTFDTTTKTLNFVLSAVNQREYNKRFPLISGIAETLIGLPLVSQANNKYYAKYFKGYPFDISVTKGTLNGAEDIFISNTTNGMSNNFPSASIKGFERVVFSDGESSTTVENVLPLVNGFNNLTISVETDAYLQLEVEDGCDGVYVKWLNDSGGYSYWLFRSNQTQRRFKSLGYLQNDNHNLEDTTSQEVSMGVSSNDSITVFNDLLREEQKNLISTMLDSPKVYLFTGTPFSQNNFNDWIEVKLRQSSFPIKQVRNKLYNITIKFDLPSNNNISL